MVDYSNNKEYFATLPIDELGDALSSRVSDYYTYLTSSSLVDLWRKSFYAYYGLREDTYNNGFGIFAVGHIRAGGAEGEVASIKVNHYRNLLTHILVLTTQQRPALKTRAINSDSESLSQATLGDGIVDYYMKERKLETYIRDAVETCLIFGEAYVRIDWDATLGKELMADPVSGVVIREGDVVFKNYTPFDVIRDTTEPSSDVSWYICHDIKNRHDLAIKYSTKAEEILNVSTDTSSGKKYTDPTKLIPQSGVGTRRTELIDVYEFIHKKTAAVPEGRYSVFLEDGTMLFDGPLAFADMPVYRVASANLLGSPFGYTVGFDLLGIQGMIDKLYSIVCSNQLSSGMQNFWSPPGNQVEKYQLAGGLNLIESVAKPEVLELLSTPAEVFSFIQRLEQIMETLSGVSAVNRGEAPQNLKSGTSLAFVASQAITFNTGLQNSYNQLQEGLGTGLLHTLRDFVNNEKQAVIAGKFNRPINKSYTGAQLVNVDRVVVEQTSALSKTHSGKMEIATQLLSTGLIRNAREYLTVVATGTLEPLYESEMSEIILVKAENEDLRDHNPPIALAIDDHKMHVLEHRAILANPDARKDSVLIEMVLAHIQEHINLSMQLQVANPALLAMMGEQPMPTPMAPPQQMGQTANPASPMEQAAGEAKPPRQPNLPPNADENTKKSYEQMQQGAMQ